MADTPSSLASASQIIPVEPFDYVVFGGTGDLSYRKLLPALFHRFQDGQIPLASRIIGVSRREQSDEAYRQATVDALHEFVKEQHRNDEEVNQFVTMLYYRSVDVQSDRGWNELGALLNKDSNPIRAFYLAVGPGLFGEICQRIAAAGLNNERTRIVIEKPIGRDGASARERNESVGAVFDERQIYRIDHYLGKETVQNLMALRFANVMFEPLWNAAQIEHVEITVAESIGVEGRGGYYDKAGALRDMVQNHILQLLCLVAMEPPNQFDADAVRDEKLKVLRALRPITAQEVNEHTVRGQYRSGASEDGAVAGYLEDIEVEKSNTETFVALRVAIDNWRWSGVPFYIRTGKRLPERVSEITLTFREIPHSIFGSEAGKVASNQLVIRLQPNEGVKLSIMIKDPGPGGMRLRQIPLDMSFADSFEQRHPDAYERLLMDVIRGNPTLFMRRDEVDAAWNWIDPILTAWAESDDEPKGYFAGTWGPTASIALIERDGFTWYQETN